MSQGSFIFKLPKASGGYCNQLWHLVGYYLYAHAHDLEFILDDSVWGWKNNKGWDDYFCSNFKLLKNMSSLTKPIYYNPNCENTGYLRPELNKFSLTNYEDAYKNTMILTEQMDFQLKHVMEKFDLVPGKFDAMMVRRGSKMFHESTYISTDIYLDALIKKNTQTIFLQTDDYNCYEELQALIDERQLDINIFTICPESKRGGVTAHKHELDMIRKNINSAKNKKYTNEFIKYCKKAEDEYTPVEMRVHMEEIIIGLEICLLSNYLCVDLQSNITRMLFARRTDKSKVLVCDNSLVPENNKILINPAHPFRYA